MFTFKRMAVSNWELFRQFHGTDDQNDYVKYLTALMRGPHAPQLLILREKELEEEAYGNLLRRVLRSFETAQIPEERLQPHQYLAPALQLGCGGLHLSFPLLKKYRADARTEKKLGSLSFVGTSIHSLEQAVEAERLGVSYLTAGHIFATDCKKDMEPRGIRFLREICQDAGIPVYAIGGINEANLSLVQEAGAAGVFQMSAYMRMSWKKD